MVAWRVIVLVAVWGINLIIFCHMIWGSEGLIAYRELKQKHAAIEAEIASIDAENRSLSRDIRLLQTDERYVEKMIRQGLPRMMDKIEWYREVLELEPSSKLFFPLARLLVEDGQPEAALETLRRGLERHPEFLEARLFYIEQLYHHGQPEACVAEVTELGQLFASYPGFWQAWAASMLGSGCGDVATALRFLAASFASRPLNLNEVFERGLRSFLQEAQSSDLPRGKALADLAVMGPEDMDAQAHDAFSSPAAKPAGAGMAKGDDDAASFAAAQGRREHPLPQPTPDRPLSLRTRSMAEVLAEQGDLQGALDIYTELAAAAAGSSEQEVLQQRIAMLRTQLEGAAVEDLVPPSPDMAAGKDKLISMLEALAERVEARAQS